MKAEIIHDGTDLLSVSYFERLLKEVKDPQDGVKLFLVAIIYKNGTNQKHPALELAIKLAADTNNRVILYGAYYKPILSMYDGGDALARAEACWNICFLEFPIMQKKFVSTCDFLLKGVPKK